MSRTNNRQAEQTPMRANWRLRNMRRVFVARVTRPFSLKTFSRNRSRKKNGRPGATFFWTSSTFFLHSTWPGCSFSASE